MKDVLRKALALPLCLCMCLSLIPAAYAEDGIELAGNEPHDLSGIEEVVGDVAYPQGTKPGVREKAAPTADETAEEYPSDTFVGDDALGGRAFAADVIVLDDTPEMEEPAQALDPAAAGEHPRPGEARRGKKEKARHSVHHGPRPRVRGRPRREYAKGNVKKYPTAVGEGLAPPAHRNNKIAKKYGDFVK